MFGRLDGYIIMQLRCFVNCGLNYKLQFYSVSIDSVISACINNDFLSDYSIHFCEKLFLIGPLYLISSLLSRLINAVYVNYSTISYKSL